ncbi:selenocysteine lyase isoform X2 [Salvelinus namaycush]|uniref:Selenocysteine lyase n=1 Tax=Salvelinus namaycush TaxID=8040 RepID=A0A8U1EI04_SALNM|nr:selenocysteine lyase isoform X2 [Salvelinus namaycush]
MSEPAKASSGTRNPRDHSHHSVDSRPLSHHSAASDGHTVTSLDDHHARSHHSDTGGANGHTHSDLPFDGHIHTYIPDMDEDKIYMDYNATTPLEPQVIQAVTEALHDAWGNPSSTYTPGVKAKKIITQARENVARMVGGKAEDIIFTSGGTEANNLVFHSALEAYRESCRTAEQRGERHRHENSGTSAWPLPHILVSNVEHDSVRLTAEHLLKDATADVTSVAVSKVTGRVEVEDVLAAVRSSTCLISIMMANNETGVLMPIRELCQRIRFVNRQRQHRILLHTDAAQAIGKVRVDARDLGVDYLTIVGHKAAELVNSNLTEYETHMLDTRDYLEKQLEAVFGRERIHFNSHFPDSETLPNTCNVSILGPGLQGRKVLSSCRRLLASVGAACHSHRGDRPSHILLSCGIPEEVAANALRLSVGRGTSRAEVGLVVEDLKNAVERLGGTQLINVD